MYGCHVGKRNPERLDVRSVSIFTRSGRQERVGFRDDGREIGRCYRTESRVLGYLALSLHPAKSKAIDCYPTCLPVPRSRYAGFPGEGVPLVLWTSLPRAALPPPPPPHNPRRGITPRIPSSLCPATSTAHRNSPAS